METTVAIFLDFLSQQNLLQEYFKEVRARRFDSLGESYCKSVFDGDPSLFLASAFIWVKSSSGFEFWNSINFQWLAILGSLK